MLITAALALALTPLRPLRIGAATSLSRAAALSCKLSRTGGNKQQDLADMMARAKALREGVAPPEPLKPSAQSSKPAKAKAPKASDAEAAQDVVPAVAGEDWSCKLITGSPTEVSLQHPAFTHALVVNTSAVSALASRGRLLGPWVAKGPGPCTLCGDLPMVALRGA